jgi:hypothetical protein
MMKKLLTILFCLGAFALFSCEDSEGDDVLMEIEKELINDDFDTTSDSGKNDDFDSYRN